MRDVRTVFIGLWVARARRGRSCARRSRRAGAATSAAAPGGRSARGAIGLAVGVVVARRRRVRRVRPLFELFHRIFFAGGSYTFDPATDRLVQLFPFRFWQETAIVVGAV